ncbi:hypothetical protein [uncultured Paraglaciecola sp.]|uniref:hypothetical protein n=1 Tax=uncultured Paraglaciecola sp. TaxID=1765024 RepID=UPI0026110FCC|nr:hypothetical protein [uncultured Paraglaciecola sp.]
MNKLKAITQRYIAISVLIALLFNSVGSLVAASSMVSHAQSFADDDRVLICTGSTYKWISLSSFELTGKVEFVDAPENAPTYLQEIKCTYAFLADPTFDDLWVITQPHSTLGINTSSTIGYFNAIYATAPHRLALSRAPPTFS